MSENRGTRGGAAPRPYRPLRSMLIFVATAVISIAAWWLFLVLGMTLPRNAAPLELLSVYPLHRLAGCGLTLAAVALIGGYLAGYGRVQSSSVLWVPVIIAVAFTGAWTWHAIATDLTELWALWAIALIVGIMVSGLILSVLGATFSTLMGWLRKQIARHTGHG